MIAYWLGFIDGPFGVDDHLTQTIAYYFQHDLSRSIPGVGGWRPRVIWNTIDGRIGAPTSNLTMLNIASSNSDSTEKLKG